MSNQPPGLSVTVDEPSMALLERARAGDAEALNALLARYRPRLLRWAHGRLGSASHALCDTEDLVQNTLIKAVRNLGAFEAGEAPGLQNYLRLAIRNAVRDEVRKARRRPAVASMESAVPSGAPSPLERAMGGQRLARYEAALHTLSPEEREAIVARFEFGYTHEELAAALGKNTADAARKICAKAIARLLANMDAVRLSSAAHAPQDTPPDA
jgi:RNA polymerase sigma-70 factor (ECF subfamily)